MIPNDETEDFRLISLMKCIDSLTLYLSNRFRNVEGGSLKIPV